MAFLLSTGLGAVLSAFLPIGAFLFVVAFASLVSVGLALVRGGSFGGALFVVSVDTACAQAGYVAGVVGTALVTRAWNGRSVREDQAAVGDAEGEDR